MCSTWNISRFGHGSRCVPRGTGAIPLAQNCGIKVRFRKVKTMLILPSFSNSDALMRRRVIQGGIAFAASSLLPGCGSTSSSSTTPPPPPPPANPNPQPTPTGPVTQAILSVSATSAGSIGPAFAGLSYEKASLYEPLFTPSNADLIGLFKRLGSSLLRIGGSSVDQNVWTPNGAGQTPGQIAPNDVDSVAAFVQATGWQCLYGVNLGGAATGATTPALAAEEVAYAAQQFGSSLFAIEIGNEPDLFPGTHFPSNWTVNDFIALWEEFRSAIVAATPNVAVTGPGDAYDLTYTGFVNWTIPFGQAVTKSDITRLTQHYYRANGEKSTSTSAYLITPDTNLVTELSMLLAGAQSIGVPFAMTECNSYYNGGATGASDTYASSLWVIDFLFDCALGGAVGANMMGGGNGAGAAYTPIADNNGTVVDVRPEYYGILLFALAGQGTLYTTQLNVGGLNATAYAVHASSGGLNLVVVNKDSTQNLKITAQLPQSASSATLIEMTQLSAGTSAPSITATSGVSIQGASVNLNGSFSPSDAYILSPSGDQLQFYVPALSAVLIQIT
jgi:hypothetical protein